MRALFLRTGARITIGAAARGCRAVLMAFVMLSLPTVAMAGGCEGGTGKPCTAAALLVPPSLPGLGVQLPVLEPPPQAAPPESEPPAAWPFSVQKSDTSMAVRTELSDVGAYQERELSRKIESVKPMLPAGSKLPKPAPSRPPPLNLWTGVEARGLDDTRPNGEPNANIKTSAGADLKISATSTAGVAAERQEPAEIGARAGQPEDDKLSAYLTLGAMPGVCVDWKAQWERDGAAGSGGSKKSSLSVAPHGGQALRGRRGGNAGALRDDEARAG